MDFVFFLRIFICVTSTHRILTVKAISELRIALVHDWLTGMRGGEKVLEVLCELYPRATLFTLLHNKGAMSPVIENMKIETSFIQKLPMKERRYRSYLPIFPRAIESFNFSDFDLIISTSHCVAKGARPASHALHICYCFTPMRYVWDQYEEYFGKGRADVVTRSAMALVAPALRNWDVQSASRVDFFVADSWHVAKRIERYYSRTADVIHGPVDTTLFTISETTLDYYLVVSALVPYKRADLAIETFNQLGHRLIVIGSGPEESRLKSRAASNIEFLGWQDDESLAKFYANCRALIFPGEEDFGIVPLEAMASGRPVIAFRRGGALETVVGEGENPTGIFFNEQSVASLKGAIEEFGKRKFNPQAIRQHAEKFDRKNFRSKLEAYIKEKVANHFA
jgi:glycosyltransferase involved in cell wall biosynthesis